MKVQIVSIILRHCHSCVLKCIQIIHLRLYFSLALRDEEIVRSPVILDETTNDEKTSNEMNLYENNEDADYMEEKLNFLEDETATLGEYLFSC